MKGFKRFVLLQLYKILEINLIQDNGWLFKNDPFVSSSFFLRIRMNLTVFFLGGILINLLKT
jgi:hypothetical protein